MKFTPEQLAALLTEAADLGTCVDGLRRGGVNTEYLEHRVCLAARRIAEIVMPQDLRGMDRPAHPLAED